MQLQELAANQGAAANPAIASRLQPDALVGRVAELGSLGRNYAQNWVLNPSHEKTYSTYISSRSVIAGGLFHHHIPRHQVGI
jgi:hypothetical protein